MYELPDASPISEPTDGLQRPELFFGMGGSPANPLGSSPRFGSSLGLDFVRFPIRPAVIAIPTHTQLEGRPRPALSVSVCVVMSCRKGFVRSVTIRRQGPLLRLHPPPALRRQQRPPGGVPRLRQDADAPSGSFLVELTAREVPQVLARRYRLYDCILYLYLDFATFLKWLDTSLRERVEETGGFLRPP